MGIAPMRVWANVLLIPFVLMASSALAQESSQPHPPPAAQEVSTELSDSENAAFNQLRRAMDSTTQAALFDMLDDMAIGPRGAFVAQLLRDKPEQRSNILGLIAKLKPQERIALATQITEPNLEEFDERQWTNFFDYVGSVAPDEAYSKIFVPFSMNGIEVSQRYPVMIWHNPQQKCAAPASDPPSCGWSFSVPPPEVTGGDFARPTPWQVQIFMSDKAGAPYTNHEIKEEFEMFGENLANFQRWHKCGGILLPGNWVLTAAHCITDNPKFGPFIKERRVRTGTDNLVDGGTTWRIAAVVKHAGYGDSNANDIALLKIEADAQTRLSDNSFARPIGLPVGRSSAVPLGATLVVTGWGATGHAGIGEDTRDLTGKAQVPSSMLLETELKKVSLSSCNDNPNYKAVGVTVQAGEICALGVDDTDSCQGDSGGPLVYHTKRGPRLVGIVSFGPGCGLHDTPGVYTDVAYYRSWILGAMKQAKRNQEIAWQEGKDAVTLH